MDFTNLIPNYCDVTLRACVRDINSSGTCALNLIHTGLSLYNLLSVFIDLCGLCCYIITTYGS